MTDLPDAGSLGGTSPIPTQSDFMTAIEQLLLAVRERIYVGRKLFTSTGTFTVPAGVAKIFVTCVGGGGGAGGGWISGDTGAGADGNPGVASKFQYPTGSPVYLHDNGGTGGGGADLSGVGTRGDPHFEATADIHRPGIADGYVGMNNSLLRPYGGGGDALTGSGGISNYGGGGGCAAGTVGVISVTAGQTYAVVVGTGGNGGLNSSGGLAGDTGKDGAVLIEWGCE